MQTVPVIVQLVFSTVFIGFLTFLCGRLFYKMVIQSYQDRSKQREQVKKIVQSKARKTSLRENLEVDND